MCIFYLYSMRLTICFIYLFICLAFPATAEAAAQATIPVRSITRSPQNMIFSSVLVCFSQLNYTIKLRKISCLYQKKSVVYACFGYFIIG